MPIATNLEKKESGGCRKETKDNISIITWNNTGIKGCCELSLDNLGLDYLVLGKNIRNWRNINKITSALEVIDSINTPYIMALDCFDVIVLRDPYEAMEKFKKMDCDMLFNAEKIYFPDYGLAATGYYSITDKWKIFEANIENNVWKYLNSGALLAKTEFYKEFLINCLQRYNTLNEDRESFPLPKDPFYKKYPAYKISDSDQLIAHWMHYDYYPKIKIDYQMKIFFNTMDTAFDDKAFDITEGIHIKYTTGHIAKLQAMRFLIKIYLSLKKIKAMLIISTNYHKKMFKQIEHLFGIKINYKQKIKRDIDNDKLQKQINEFKETGVTKEKRNPRLIVSITSFGQRMYDVHFALYSLLNQTLKPDEIILWLGEKEFPHKEGNLPQSVLSLKNNGLTIKWCKDMGPYTKLIPALKEYPDDIIVTADDDIYYPRKFLELLYGAYLKEPQYIHCHRVHKITFDKNKNIQKYSKWIRQASNIESSLCNFLTGAGGVLYPPNSLYKDVLNEELFLKLSPTADDIWFWA
ncbi:MAG: glycosyltransferase domain-containing protein, partial [Smithella sp.]